MPLPQSGDHLVSACTGYQHHGLYLGNHQVINYLGFSTGNRYRR
ncbi:lecithin retinol acyltransferase family protein [Aeromonas hydrophila]|nr:lecithin retinol acyltransferase family protein [Aeromonas hydrophila]MCX4114695.1 lecithin retinol acyltransferase family protein [Aeromonas hydrophila]